MKKLFVLTAALFAALTVSAQIPDGELCVYGVDYSLAKVNAAEESDDQFADAFVRINELLIREPKKYDFEKAFRRKVTSVDITPAMRSNQARHLSTLRSDPMQPATREQVQALVAGYELPQTEGTGVVLVGLLLDKATAGATYQVVFFDIATREVLFEGVMKSQAGGGRPAQLLGAHGLRNPAQLAEILPHEKAVGHLLHGCEAPIPRRIGASFFLSPRDSPTETPPAPSTAE